MTEPADLTHDVLLRVAEFLRKLLLSESHYTLTKTPEIASDIVSVDRAMEWGYGWEAGPFKQMDAVGLEFLRGGFLTLGLGEPPLLRTAQESFYLGAVLGGAIGLVVGTAIALGNTADVWETVALAATDNAQRTKPALYMMPNGRSVTVGIGVGFQPIARRSRTAELRRVRHCR